MSTICGHPHHRQRAREANAQAQQMFGRAIELDPEFAAAYAWLGRTHVVEWLLRWNEDHDCLEDALALAQRAIGLDDSLPAAHEALGYAYLAKKQFEQALVEGERAVALDPNDAEAAVTLAEILCCADAERAEEASALVEKAMRLSPHYPASYLFALAQAYDLTGRYEEAVALLKRVLARNPDHVSAHFFLAGLYGELGREDELQEELAACRRLSPHMSAADVVGRIPFKDEGQLDRIVATLRKAGVE